MLNIRTNIAPEVDAMETSAVAQSEVLVPHYHKTLTGVYAPAYMNVNDFNKSYLDNRKLDYVKRLQHEQVHRETGKKRPAATLEVEVADSEEPANKKAKTDEEETSVTPYNPANLSMEMPGDDEKEGLTVYYEEDERRGKRIARYEAIEPKVTLHLKQTHDYQGRSFLHNPLRDSYKISFLPKKGIHKWVGHNKAIGGIRWFPPHGHLLLSAGYDNKVKLWDVMGNRQCVQTYIGHSKAVKDISFNHDGAKFLSCGFDRFQRIWDTETGEVIHTFSTGKLANVGRFYPDLEKGDIFLCGMNDKKIVQWDLRSGRVVQEYDQHLGGVNTLTFIDGNRKFVTTADDKTLRVWEFDIPVVIKYIADPGMHSLPSASSHPSDQFVAFQSMDNQIVTYQHHDKFRACKKKTFKGHVTSGHACQVGFSPDGKYICSGDGGGQLWFWEWKTCKFMKKFKAHDGACIGCLWHPTEQSKVVTAGWDGQIKFWD